MYSGTTIHAKSGHIIGAHQRIDRLARRNLKQVQPAAAFPTIRQILHFEGNNGPDGIKRKSPSQDEPWHYIDPEKPDDTALVTMIVDHVHNLGAALTAGDETRAAFEAAWVAHAITDGLTPAHHYPLSDKIEELWGHPKEQRSSVLKKNLIRGDSAHDSLLKNWEYWGAKGVFSTHVLFEWGVASSMTTHRFRSSLPTDSELEQARQQGIEAVFRAAVADIHALGMYETFWKHGWTTKLAQQTRTQLVPRIIKVVTLAWYIALEEA